jgi:hypothetical protein
MDFGKKQTMKDKMAMATKKGYDSGKPSTGAKPAPNARVSPIIKKGTIGINITKKK